VPDRYNVAIFTNQGSISLRSDSKTLKSDQRSLTHFKAKVASILTQLDIPVVVLAATARDAYRKPRIRMWHELLEEIDLDVHVGPDLPHCFFVGDAGGRPARTDTKADHACSDRFNIRCGSCVSDVLKSCRDFASNVGIEFKSPEEFFLHEVPHPFVRDFEPKEYLDGFPTNASTL
jgi:bifunctional polynucleotide phosphatase/kinase